MKDRGKECDFNSGQLINISSEIDFMNSETFSFEDETILIICFIGKDGDILFVKGTLLEYRFPALLIFFINFLHDIGMGNDWSIIKSDNASSKRRTGSCRIISVVVTN